MRSVLQLRTPQNGNANVNDHNVSGVNGDPSRGSHVDAKISSPGSLQADRLRADAPQKVRFREPQIEMAHGAGGKASRRLIEGLFAPLLFESSAEPLADAAYLDFGGTQIAITADSFVVKPLSFPGGSIGELAINGTVNDLAVSGARAEAMVVTFVLEAGLPTPVLEGEVRAMRNAARCAGVTIVGGDTKVVEHGKADFMYVTTTGIGRPLAGLRVDPKSVRPGDRIILSGAIGDHGITILLARGELDLEADLRSDTRSVLPLVEAVAAAAGPGVRWMRDPTRGGVATSLNELARDCNCGIVLLEEVIPLHDAVRGACELLGLDPLHIANEGQFLAVVAPEYADSALNALRFAPGGEAAQMIGEVREQPSGAVLVTTRYGGSRIVDMLVGDPLPRIC
jgi:hydrogenase expression/formation protein HypE